MVRVCSVASSNLTALTLRSVLSDWVRRKVGRVTNTVESIGDFTAESSLGFVTVAEFLVGDFLLAAQCYAEEGMPFPRRFRIGRWFSRRGFATAHCTKMTKVPRCRIRGGGFFITASYWTRNESWDLTREITFLLNFTCHLKEPLYDRLDRMESTADYDMILPKPDDQSFLKLISLMFRQALEMSTEIRSPSILNLYEREATPTPVVAQTNVSPLDHKHQ